MANINVKKQVEIKKGVDCTEEWLCLVGLRDQILKGYRVKKDVFTIKATGEKIELHKHGMILPNRGRVEVFYVVTGDTIPTEVFKLVAVGKTHPSKKLVTEANRYINEYLLQRVNKVLEEEELLELDEEDEVLDLEEFVEEEEYLTI